MQESERPTSVRLRKVPRQIGRWVAQWGRPDVTYDYGHDVGGAHVMSFVMRQHILDLANAWRDRGTAAGKPGRYLDGEEEAEGTYR